MKKCKYYDCGWCYAPNDVATNAHSSSACLAPQNCLYLKSQMTEIERVKSEIKVLEAKLSLLEKMENYKSPAEEAYKRVYSGYPDTSKDDYGCYYNITWRSFNLGYNAALEDYKVGEYQETPQERGDRLHKEVEKLLSKNENEWKSIALSFGEKLSDVGPRGYYDFSAGEWFEWATFTYQDVVKKLQEKRCKVDVKTDLKPWEPTPQTPEEIEKGLRDAMRQAKKNGVFDEKSPFNIIEEWAEKNKRPNLYEILMEWWINDDWTDQTDESIIDSLVDLIDDQFIPPHHDTNDYQWNKCLKLMREKLR